MSWLLPILGLAGGVFSGLLGLGGAIVMVPLLLFVPPLFGFAALDMKTVAAISMVQVAFASLTGAIAHARNRFVSWRLVFVMGLTSAATSLLGAWWSARLPAETLLFVFAVISTVAAIVMLFPKAEPGGTPDPAALRFSVPAAAAIAAAVGLVGGLVGAPGAFIYVPLLIYGLGIPTRITLGSTLPIVLISSLSGLVGKLTTGQVPLVPSLLLVLGAIPGAQLGAALSRRLPVARLRLLLTLVVIASTVKLWLEVW